MDGYLVYEKTLAGDEATRNRTRIVQRNLRMILVLVDGVSTIAELVAKAGNSQMVYASIKELEAGGFITLSAERSKAASNEEKKREQPRDSEQSQRVSSFSHFSEFSTFGATAMSTKARGPLPDGSPSEQKRSSQADIQAIVARLRAEKALGSENGASMPKAGAENKLSLSLALSSDRVEPVVTSTSAQFSVNDRETRSAPSTARRLSAGNAVKKDGKIKVPTVRRYQPPKPQRSKARSLLLVLLGLFILLPLLPLFFPYDLIRPSIESSIGKSLGQEVRIGEIEFGYYPKFGIIFNQVGIGPAKDGINIDSITLKPTLDLLIGNKRFSHIEIAGMNLQFEHLLTLRDSFKSLGADNEETKIRNIALTSISWKGKQSSFTNLTGTLEYSSSGLERLSLHDHANVHTFTLRPLEKNNFALSIDAQNWQPMPTLSGLMLDYFRAEGTLSENRINFDKYSFVVFGNGTAKGQLTLEMTDTGVTADSQLEFSQINTEKLTKLFKNSFAISGDLKGKLRFSSSAPKLSEIFARALTEGDMTISYGEIKNIDLESLMRGKASDYGRSTRFDQFASNFSIDDQGIHLQRLQMNAGIINVEGSIDANDKNELKGSFTIVSKASFDERKTPAMLSGTWKTPLLSVSQR